MGGFTDVDEICFGCRRDRAVRNDGLIQCPGADAARHHLEIGLAIAEGAIEECAKNNVAITVAVLDRAGRMRIFIASDNPSPHNFELARRKAYTARTFRRPSLQWAQQTKDGADLAGQRQLADVIPLGGGVPINVGEDTIGAVGVSGSSQTGDEACAKAGVAKVADQLK